MMFVVGIYYPAKHNLNTFPAEYVINDDVLDMVALQLISKPVTFEHLGVLQSYKLLHQNTAFMADTDTYTHALKVVSGAKHKACLPIGSVLSTWMGHDGGWRCLMKINDELPCLYSLMRSGICSSLSLTHISGISPAVVDITVCAQPARPGCIIEFVSGCHIDAMMYKVQTMLGQTGTMEVSEPTKSPLEVAMGAIGEEHRSLITARFEELVNFCDKAATEMKQSQDSLTEANNKFSQYQNSKTQDLQMLGYQFEQLINQLPTELREQHTINADLIKSMTSPNEHIRMNSTSRLLQACNLQMMTANSNKRHRAEPKSSTEQIEFTSQKSVQADKEEEFHTSTNTSSDTLRRALTEAFEC